MLVPSPAGIPEQASRPSRTESGRPYRGESLEARRADQRERLLGAARDVFAERGYVASSIDDVVARAAVSRTSFYHFFDNKEDCLLAVFWRGVEQVIVPLAELAASDLEPEEKIRSGVESLVHALADDPPMARVMLIEVVGATPRAEEARSRARTEFAGLLAAQLREGPWRKAPKREVELVSVATMAAVAESVGYLVATGRLDEWRTIVEPLSRYVLRALTPDRSLARQAR